MTASCMMVLSSMVNDEDRSLVQLINAHKSLGKIPSPKKGGKSMLDIIEQHCDIIKGVQRLTTKVGEADTIHSKSYLDTIESMKEAYRELKDWDLLLSEATKVHLKKEKLPISGPEEKLNDAV